MESGNVRNYVTRVMQLMRRKLLQQDDWSDWWELEYLQLDQYNAQGMFGDLVAIEQDNVIFFLVWTYSIETPDAVRRHIVSAMGPHVLEQLKYLTKHM
jgi:hypothetical protein